MGEPRRPAPLRPLPGADRLYHRCVDRRAPAQPALHPGHRSGVLLPQVQEHHRDRVAHSPGRGRRHSGPHPVRPGAGLHRGCPVVRAAVRQHLRHGLQHRRTRLHDTLHHRRRMGRSRALPSEVGRGDPRVVPVGRDPLGHAVHRLRVAHPGSAHRRPRRVPVDGQEAPREDSHRVRP